MTHYPPVLPPERVDQMIAFATSFAQEKHKPSFWQILTASKSRFALSAAGSALVAASIVFFVSSETPQQKTQHTTPNEVSDIMLYDMLEDLS